MSIPRLEHPDVTFLNNEVILCSHSSTFPPVKQEQMFWFGFFLPFRRKKRKCAPKNATVNPEVIVAELGLITTLMDQYCNHINRVKDGENRNTKEGICRSDTGAVDFYTVNPREKFRISQNNGSIFFFKLKHSTSWCSVFTFPF